MKPRELHDKPYVPWYTEESIEYLEENLKDTFVGFEFGAGGSTVWIAKRIKHLTVAEDSEDWFNEIGKTLKKENLNNVDLHLLERENEDYVNKILEFPDHHFDIVFIDGRDRIKCLNNSISKIKPGGVLLFDNWQRKRYVGGFEPVENWEMLHFPPVTKEEPPWRTVIYIKPEEGV